MTQGCRPSPEQNCDQINTELTTGFDSLSSLVISEDSKQALALGDKLLSKLDDEKAKKCDVPLWIRYYRGEALELNFLFDQALVWYYEIIRDAEALKKTEIIAQCYISIGRCHEWLGRKEDCLRNLQIARKLIQENHLYHVESQLCVRYASYQRIFASKDTAKVYAQKAVDFGKKYNVLRSQYDGYFLLGILTPDLSLSNQYLRKSADLFIKIKNYQGAAFMYLNIYKQYEKAGFFDIGYRVIDTVEYYAHQMKEDKTVYKLLSSASDSRRKYFVHKNNLDSAYFYLDLASTYNKKGEWYVSQEDISKNEVDFAIEKEKEKIKQAEQISYILKIGLTLTAFLLLILSWVVINNQKKRKLIATQNLQIIKNNEALTQSNEHQAMLLSEVHHRVKNNLQLVISLLTIHGSKSKNKNVQSFLDDISFKVRSIALIHEQLYQVGDFHKINISHYIKELILKFRELQHKNETFTFELESEDILFNLETALPIGLICTELMSNSLKYAVLQHQKLSIKISLKRSDNKYIIKFSDNGPGYADNSASKNDKLGISLINNMVRQLQAESSIFNDHGAIFTMLFEEKKVSVV